MITSRDLVELEQALSLICRVIERHNVHEEDALERRSSFRLLKNEEKEPSKKEK